MAAFVKATLCLIVPLLLLQQLQTVRCDEDDEGGVEGAGEDDEAGEKHESDGPSRSEPLSWDDLQYTRLQEINTVAKKITETFNPDSCPLAAAEAKIKPLRSAAQVDNVVNKALEEVSGGCLKKKTKEVDELLCSVGQRFKRHLKSVVSLAELLAEHERPEFLEITKTAPVVDDEKFKEAIENLNPNNEQKNLQVDLKAIAEQVNAKFGSNPLGRKEQAYTKLAAAREQVGGAVKNVMDGANVALNSFFDAMIGVKNVQRELKSTQEYPKDIAEEEARIKKALAVYKALGCSKVNDAKDDDDDDASARR
ncbi:unnamed protein product [Bemisia tabaci]|uniref:Uncharacterized protein n=1 Tax=Bemisia tabaci TaxID=7038 RepID=A0A9P0A2I7_BEMTA|nr:PREDICTED: uncharacterized protein LOC109038315 isoform X1 [Bemisia tabaci]CAH0382688.1 unnamed protein product [Bemisia tabaci]